MASQMGDKGTFSFPKAQQSQDKPGLEAKMNPPSEATKLESCLGSFVEYQGSGKLNNKKVIITGGDSGIGRSVAVFMAREGADVTIVHLPQEQVDANDTKKLIEAAGRTCNLYSGDLRQYATCQNAVEDHVKKFGKINVLVNNASKQEMNKDFSQIDLELVEDTFRTNIIQMMALTKYALPHMSKGDSIINSSSIVSSRGSASMVDYGATKGAIEGFTRSLAQQLTPKGIRVNAVAPGAVYTPIQVDTRPAQQMENWGTKYSIGRPHQPSEVAPTYVFLASREATLYYGQVVHPHPLSD